MAQSKPRRASSRSRPPSPPDHAFGPLLRFLAAEGLTLEKLAARSDRNKSNAGRVLRTALRFEDSIRAGISELRPRYLAALSEPESEPNSFLTGLALFPVRVLAEPPHISRLESLWGVARDLDSMLSPGQFELVAGCLSKTPPASVVLIAPDRAANRARFRRLCEELRTRAGLSKDRLDSLCYVAGPATVGWGGASTAIANGETEFPLGFQGLFSRLDDGRPDVLATVMTRDTTRLIAREIAEMLDRVRDGGFRDDTGGQWSRITGSEASSPEIDRGAIVRHRAEEALHRRGMTLESTGRKIVDAMVTVRGRDGATGEPRDVSIPLSELLSDAPEMSGPASR